MALPNIFTKEVADRVINRIEKLNATTQPQWGKMSVAQMLAHCNVTYELIYENKHPKPGFFMKLILKGLVKNKVINETGYKQSSQTAPAFIISDARDFETEKNRLVAHIRQTQELGENHFHNKESHSFGVLDKTGWNNMMYKHLEHHLAQFGV